MGRFRGRVASWARPTGAQTVLRGMCSQCEKSIARPGLPHARANATTSERRTTVARGSGCDGNDEQAQPRARHLTAAARKRAAFQEVYARNAADPHAWSKELATLGRQGGWGEKRLRAKFGELLTEDDYAELMAIRLVRCDEDGNIVAYEEEE